jgi:Flp pilus assembly protein TadD
MRLIPIFLSCALIAVASLRAEPSLSPELLPLAREARDHFASGRYAAAEEAYRKILEQAPKNHYALSNLGVVLFRAGKLPAAEEVLREAVAVAPGDAFSHTTLGIVCYFQKKLDEAATELTKAAALDSKNASVHNYLGQIAREKGQHELATEEFRKAVALDPSYAAEYLKAGVGDFLTPLEKERFQSPQQDLSPKGVVPAR